MLFLNIISFISILENNEISNANNLNTINNSESKFYPIPILSTLTLLEIRIG